MGAALTLPKPFQASVKPGRDQRRWCATNLFQRPEIAFATLGIMETDDAIIVVPLLQMRSR